MVSRKSLWLCASMLLLATGACATEGTAPTPTPLAPPPSLVSPTPPPAATAAVPSAVPTLTPVPATSTPDASPTPTEVTVTAAGGDVACHFGPAVEYSIDGKLTAGNTTRALARDATSTWVRIEHETQPRWNCWLKAEAVTVSGNLASVPVEPAPAAIVTNVEVAMTPARASVPGCVFPYTFSVKFWITVNGPATVTFQRSRSNGSAAPTESKVFTAFGRYEFTDSYPVGAVGSHWFQVEVFSPNGMSMQGTAEAVCGP